MERVDAGEVEEIEIRMLLEAIHARYGYDFRDYAPTSMRRRVLATLNKFRLTHLGELQHKVLVDPLFFESVLENLTVRVTEMFRDPPFYKTFRSRVVPVLHTYPLLKIWHCGCASGEEVYATAIMLTEEGLYDRAQIYATDLSPQAIEQSRQGTYSSKHLCASAENYQKAGGLSTFSSYYTEAYDGFSMKEALRRNILFFQHNLTSDHAFGEMHVVFCRNVLIYFDQDLKNRVVHKITQSLCPGGFVCLGSGERLKRSAGEYIEVSPQDRIYQYQG